MAGWGRLFGAAPPTGPVAALSQRLGYRLQNSRFKGSPGPGQTIGTLIHLPAEPSWIRLVFVNDRPEPWRLDGCAVAPVAALDPAGEPLDAAGRPDPGLLRPVRFSAGGRDAPPALTAPEGDAFAIDVPGTPFDDARPAHLLSDWLPLRALPRRDGGPGFLVLVRSFSQGGMRFAASTGGPDPALGRLHAGYVADGEALRKGDALSNFRRDDTLFACHGVQIVGPTPGATVLAVGDSIIQSSCTTGEISGYAARACAMISRPGRPVSFFNEGFPGRHTLGSCTNGLWAVELLRPQAAVIQAWSRNEPFTHAQADLAFNRAMVVADAVRRHGGVPVLATAAPSFPGEPGPEAARHAGNERIRALGRAGWPIIDVDRIWGTGASPNVYQTAYDAGDGWHPSDRGSDAAARVLAPTLERLIAQR